MFAKYRWYNNPVWELMKVEWTYGYETTVFYRNKRNGEFRKRKISGRWTKEEVLGIEKENE